MTFLSFRACSALSSGKLSISRTGLSRTTMASLMRLSSPMLAIGPPSAALFHHSRNPQGPFQLMPRLNADILNCLNSWQATREKFDYAWKLTVIAIRVFLPFFIGRFCMSRSFFHPFGFSTAISSQISSTRKIHMETLAMKTAEHNSCASRKRKAPRPSLKRCLSLDQCINPAIHR